MPREIIERPQISVGDRVWVNHPVSGHCVHAWLVVGYSPDDNRPPVHWHLVPFDESNGTEKISVRADSVRKFFL